MRRLSHEQIAKRVDTSRRAKRSHLVASVALWATFVSVGIVVLALMTHSVPILVAGVAVAAACSAIVIVGSLIAARAVRIGGWRAIQFAGSSAGRALWSIARLWAGA